MAKSKTVDEYIIDATDNIQKDRDAATRLLQDIMNELANSTDKWKHRNLGETASRYLETLQRSNEQLVKLAALVQKKEPRQQGFSEKEKDSIFDLIMDEKING